MDKDHRESDFKYDLSSSEFYRILLTREILFQYVVKCGPGSSVGIATDYGLDGPGSNPGGNDFPSVHTGPGAHPASCKIGTGSFPGGKVRPGRAADHSPPSSAAVMKE